MLCITSNSRTLSCCKPCAQLYYVHVRCSSSLLVVKRTRQTPGLTRRARMCAQLQKLKVDTEAAMLELDQIMRQNELTIAVVAALPALAIAGFALTALRAWLTPSPPDPRWEALPARCDAHRPPQVKKKMFACLCIKLTALRRLAYPLAAAPALGGAACPVCGTPPLSGLLSNTFPGHAPTQLPVRIGGHHLTRVESRGLCMQCCQKREGALC